MNKPLFYETVVDGLVPVKFARSIDPTVVVVEVTETTGAYKKGELITTYRRHVVHRVSGNDMYQMVRTAQCPL